MANEDEVQEWPETQAQRLACAYGIAAWLQRWLKGGEEAAVLRWLFGDEGERKR